MLDEICSCSVPGEVTAQGKAVTKKTPDLRSRRQGERWVGDYPRIAFTIGVNMGV